MNSFNIGLDIGGTKCRVVKGYASTEDLPVEDFVLERRAFLTEKRGPEAILNTFYDAIDALIEGESTTRLNAIGISCGGPLNPASGVIMSPPNLIGWDNVPIVDILTSRYGVPVRLQNDANACALAEWLHGAGRGCRNMVFITMGTGLGAGIIANGSILNGSTGMAGEVGHIRLARNGPVGYGKEGAFEGFCSGGGIAQVARTMALEKLQMGETSAFCDHIGRLDSISARSVAEAAKEGDKLAVEVYRKVGDYLGRGLSVLIDILNPEMIVIGSIFERSGELLIESMEAAIEKESLSLSSRACRIVPAKLGDSIGDIAALTVAEYEKSYDRDNLYNAGT